MATVASKLLSAEEFFDFAHLLENRDRRFELEDGEIVEMSLPGERHGVVCCNVAGILWTYTFARKKGYVCSNDTGLVLRRDLDTVRGPDVTLYNQSRQYDELQIKFAERIPDLVVKVLSPNDRFGKVVKRMALFQKKGVRLVWLVDPEERSITVLRPGHEPEVLEENEQLAGMDVLPDFKCAVRDFFALPG